MKSAKHGLAGLPVCIMLLDLSAQAIAQAKQEPPYVLQGATTVDMRSQLM